jgi:hypothetical protein
MFFSHLLKPIDNTCMFSFHLHKSEDNTWMFSIYLSLKTIHGCFF